MSAFYILFLKFCFHKENLADSFVVFLLTIGIVSFMFVVFGLFSDEYSMKIVDVQLSDDGAYNCHVIRTDTEAYLKSDPAYLTVLGTDFLNASKCLLHIF